MKKLFVFALAAAMLLFSLNVYAVERGDIELSQDNFGSCLTSVTAEQLTWGEGTVSADGILMFSLKLPRAVEIGETVVLKIKGQSEGDFRVWLLSENEKTFSNVYKMSDHAFEGGAFDRLIELTAQDFDNSGNQAALDICFKAPTAGDVLSKLELDSATVYFCTMEEYEGIFDGEDIPLTSDNFGSCVTSVTADDLTWDDGAVNANGITLFSLKLPETIPNGEKVVVSIKGTSDGDFRLWLLSDNEKTFSNPYKMSENGFENGEFERVIEFTAQDWDKVGNTEAKDICFKAPTANDVLNNLTLESVRIFHCNMEEYEANSIDFSAIDALVDDANKKLDALYDSVDDADAVNAGIAEAETTIATLSEIGSLGYQSVLDAVSALSDKIDDLRDETLLSSLKEYVDKVNSALERAKSSPNDKTVLNDCMKEAEEAANYVFVNGLGYPKTQEKGRELKETVTEIEKMISALSSTDDTSQDTSDEKPDGTGCGSSIGSFSAILMLTTVSGCAVVSHRKKISHIQR